MRYRIVFYTEFREVINYVTISTRVPMEMFCKAADLAKCLTEIQEKGYTIQRVVIPGVSDADSDE